MTMRVRSPPPMYIRASCMQLTYVQRRRRPDSYGGTGSLRCARHGAVAEWLGRGLQSLAHQFDSGRRLSQ
jgi:hypothetical protein